jgi:hypothetical protein
MTVTPRAQAQARGRSDDSPIHPNESEVNR